MSSGDDGWRKRLGIDFPIDLSDSDIEEEGSGARRGSGGGRGLRIHQDELVVLEEADRVESFDSFSQEEEELARYLKEFGTTPPRTVRLRRQKERDAYCLQAKEAAKATLKRRDTAERFLSLPGFTDHGIPEASPEITRQHYREQKRSKDRKRSRERNRKKSTIEDLSSVLSALSTQECDERCESMPPLSPAYRVESRTRYMSVSCRKVHDENDTEQTEIRKQSTAELPQDRVAYFKRIQGQVKLGAQDLTFSNRQQSEEEAIYQQELFEILWLELQAWQAGLDCTTFDLQLVTRRTEVLEVIQEVLSFKFDPERQEKRQDNVGSFPNKKITTVDQLVTTGDLKIGGVPVAAYDLPDGGGGSRLVGGEEECDGCLSIWCVPCKDNQTKALMQVAALLKKLDYVESLFPSTQKLALHHPEWEQHAFTNRYKALCVWYNTTVQLRMKVEVLGKLLGNMTNTLIPWPTFTTSFMDHLTTPTSSHDSGAVVQQQFEEANLEAEAQVPKSSSMSNVRFVIDSDKSDGSSNPSDSNNSTDSGHTTASTNSGLLMPPSHSAPHPTSGLRRCLSDIFIEANPYRKYVEKLLRNKGMKKTFDKVAEVIRDVMNRTMCVLEFSQEDKQRKADSDIMSVALAETSQELSRYRAWTSKFTEMSLQPFYALFIFLASVSMQMMRECLKLRLEQMPEKPSRLSIRELMREYKEGVKFAVLVRQKYLRVCQALFAHLTPKLRENLEVRQNQAIEELDANIKRMLEVYLEWLDQFVCMLHREPHASGIQRNFLQEEWRFVQATCPHVTEGDSLAATRFCNIACHMLCSVGDFIDTGIDDQMAVMQDLTLDNLDHTEDYEDLEQDEIQKKRLRQRCRALQVLLAETRERSLRAAGLAKMLRKDLEVAAEFSLCERPEAVLARLQLTGHVRVLAPHSHNHFIFVPGRIKDKREYIWHLLDMRVGGMEQEDGEQGGYLVLMRCDNQAAASCLWTGDVIEIEPTADCTITLSRIVVTSLLLVVSCGTMLVPFRREFLFCMGDTTTIGRHTRAHTYQALACPQREAIGLCDNLVKNVRQVESLTDLDVMTPDVEDGERHHLHLVTRDVVHQYFMFGFEYHKEVTRLVTGQHRVEVAPMLVNLARMWMKFVQAHYSHGKGSRPRWANAGLEFIVFVCNPHNTRYLQEHDFQQLVKEIECCREYIIGTAPETKQPGTPLTPVLPRHFRSSSSCSSTIYQGPERSLSSSSQGENSPVINPTDSPLLRRHLMRRSLPSVEKSVDVTDSSSQYSSERPMHKVRRQIFTMDARLDQRLRDERVIGSVSNVHRDKIHFKPRTVNFSWQRGFKIAKS
ncbi:Mitogen-activated protein kinase kinase kinase 4 [Chionoecetes opilio]|uniref:Mitogen-activated protein kinase kinase kinase 4 n=1 Tax=Chionoecetes opilio TaxID=41210 RepID=A0A8J4Y6L5_CHIOP|nr:Mitogen-activated protein kinase kinase kinase 4 [Chionoecetes opilio]